jgi:hypothetical protein
MFQIQDRIQHMANRGHQFHLQTFLYSKVKERRMEKYIAKWDVKRAHLRKQNEQNVPTRRLSFSFIHLRQDDLTRRIQQILQ